jgi:hypothetical protein
MERVAELFFKFLTLVFTIGWIGCLLTIPMAAFKFFSVLFDKDSGEEGQREFRPGAPARS